MLVRSDPPRLVDVVDRRAEMGSWDQFAGREGYNGRAVIVYQHARELLNNQFQQRVPATQAKSRVSPHIPDTI